MTTGALIYLVSSCSSGEEFVAAFRRYADRNGLFIPMAEPIAAGRRGRFAVALSTGGVMIEGEAEIVSSARTPSVVHGRIGMTIRFVDPDPQSKTVLVELEKARLSMRPPPPSVPPRPAEIPAAPRAVPPAPAGRIDATNALAECVAIGAIDGLEIVDKSPAVAPLKSGPKFVVPSIPPMGGARAKAPSVPPFMMGGLASGPITPPAGPTDGPPGRTTDGAVPLQATEHVHTTSHVAPPPPALSTRTPVAPPTIQMAVPSVGADDAWDDEPAISRTSTLPSTAPPPPVQVARPAPLDEPPVRDTIAELPQHRDTIAVIPQPLVPAPLPPPTSGEQPAVEPPVRDSSEALDESDALELDPPTLTKPLIDLRQESKPPPKRRDETLRVTPPPLPVVKPPIVGPISAVRSAIEADEPTDLTTIPNQLVGRATSEGEAEESPVHAMPMSEAAPRATAIGVAVGPTVVEEATPSGDWTMTPGANGPTIAPRAAAAAAAAAKVTPASIPTGDWMISIDPQAEDGWSEPSKIEKRPPLPGDRPGDLEPEKSGALPAAPAPAPAHSRPADVLGIAEPKVQIDPTLIEPLMPMPVFDEPPVHPVGSQPAIAPPLAASSSNGMAPMPLMPMPQTPLPSAPLAYVGPGGSYPMDQSQGFARAEPAPGGRNKRLIVILASAALAVAVGIALVIAFSGSSGGGGGGAGEAKVAPAPAGDPARAASDAGIAVAEADAALQITATIDAGTEVPAPDASTSTPPEPVAAVACTFDVTSLPTGAEISNEAEVLGTTPTKLTLPCNAEVKLTFKKGRLAAVERKFTPTPKNKPLKVVFAKPTYSVKVNSTPTGAAISVGGRPQGFTPTTIRLPANEASMITFTKDGFTTDMQKVVPKQNNQTVTTTLRRAPRKAIR